MSFKVNNVTINISFLFCIFVCFMVAFDKSGTVLLCFVFMLFHELSHIIAMIFCRVKIKKLYFEPFGIYIEKEEKSLNAKQDFLVLISGCFFNFAACFIFAIVFLIWKNKIFLNCALINFVLFVFNALPVRNLDGGDALLLMLSELKIVRNPLNAVKTISFVCCIVMLILGIILCVKVRFNPSLIIVSLYLIISLFISS